MLWYAVVCSALLFSAMLCYILFRSVLLLLLCYMRRRTCTRRRKQNYKDKFIHRGLRMHARKKARCLTVRPLFPILWRQFQQHCNQTPSLLTVVDFDVLVPAVSFCPSNVHMEECEGDVCRVRPVDSPGYVPSPMQVTGSSCHFDRTLRIQHSGRTALHLLKLKDTQCLYDKRKKNCPLLHPFSYHYIE